MKTIVITNKTPKKSSRQEQLDRLERELKANFHAQNKVNEEYIEKMKIINEDFNNKMDEFSELIGEDRD